MFQRVCMRMTSHLLVVLSVLAAAGCRSGAPSEAPAVAPELKLEGVRFRVYRGTPCAPSVTPKASRSGGIRRRSGRGTWTDVSRATGLGPDRPPGGRGFAHVPRLRGVGRRGGRRGDDAARTERARYEPGEGDGLVRGDDPVVVQGRGYRLDGAGFTLDPAQGNIAVRGGARLVAGLPGAR